MKNNVAECVLIYPEEYVHLMDELNDARLLAITSERLIRFGPTSLLSLKTTSLVLTRQTSNNLKNGISS